MEIKSYINELLYQYECVTIPEFGSFLTRKIPAKINFQGDFSPPKKEISFNSLLKTNDGILAKHIAQKTNSSYESVIKIINKKTIKWIEKLEMESLNFPGIGEIKLNNYGKLEFIPSNKINFYKDSFGLDPFKREPLINISSDKNINNKLNMENTNNDDLLFTPEKNNKKTKMKYIKYSAVGFLTIILIGSVYFFVDNYLSNQKLNEIEIAQKKIKDNVQKATFDLGKLSTVELNIKSNSDNSSSNQNYYSIIAGSFRSIKNAENKLNSLIKEGYNAEMAQKKALKDFIELHMENFSQEKKLLIYYFLLNILFKKKHGFLKNDSHFKNPVFRVLRNCIIKNTKLYR